MQTRTLSYLVVITCMCFGAIAPKAAVADGDAPRITKEEVKALLGDPGVVILDARTGSSWSGSDKKIKGAVRVDPHDVGSWAGNYPREKKLIVYCS